VPPGDSPRRVARHGDRKHRAFVLIVSIGGALCVMALSLAALDKLTPDGVKVLEAFASMASIAVFSFMGGNAVEHLSKKSKPEPEGDS